MVTSFLSEAAEAPERNVMANELSFVYAAQHVRSFVSDLEHTSLDAGPFEYVGDSLVVNPARMLAGSPYLAFFIDRPVVGVKRSDETIDFYAIPREGE